MQKYANLVELEKCCRTHIFLKNFVLIQPRTSPPKNCKNFANFPNVANPKPLPNRRGGPPARASGRRGGARSPSGSSRTLGRPASIWAVEQFASGIYDSPGSEGHFSGTPPTSSFSLYVLQNASNVLEIFRKLLQQNIDWLQAILWDSPNFRQDSVKCLTKTDFPSSLFLFFFQ